MTARDELARDGVTLLRGAVEPGVLQTLREAVEANRRAARPLSRQVLYTHTPEPAGRPPLTALMDQWLSPHRYQGAGSTSQAAETLRPTASALLDAPAVLFQDLLLIKRPGQKPFPWHQDFGFWPVDKPAGVIIWVPLQASNGDTGALQFAKGSHRLGPRPVIDLHDGRPQDRSARLGFVVDEWPLFAPTYAEGDAVAFSPVTFHGSPPMRREAVRAAWSCIFLDPTVRWQHANAPNHPLCRVVPDGAPVTEFAHA